MTVETLIEMLKKVPAGSEVRIFDRYTGLYQNTYGVVMLGQVEQRQGTSGVTIINFAHIIYQD